MYVIAPYYHEILVIHFTPPVVCCHGNGIFFLKPRESVRAIMKEHNILSVNQIFHLEVSKIMQKHALNSIPSPFQKIFRARIRTSSTSTRSGTTITPAPSSTLKCAQSIR